MAIVKIDFTSIMPSIFHGAVKTLSFTVKNYDGDGNLIGAQNISSWTIHAVFFDTAKNLALTKATTQPNGGTDGVVNVALTAADTGTTLTQGRYLLMLNRMDSGTPDCLASGDVKFLGPIVQ